MHARATPRTAALLQHDSELMLQQAPLTRRSQRVLTRQCRRLLRRWRARAQRRQRRHGAARHVRSCARPGRSAAAPQGGPAVPAAAAAGSTVLGVSQAVREHTLTHGNDSVRCRHLRTRTKAVARHARVTQDAQMSTADRPHAARPSEAATHNFTRTVIATDSSLMGPAAAHSDHVHTHTCL